MNARAAMRAIGAGRALIGVGLIVAPAALPNPTVTSATFSFAASAAAARTSSTGSNASPSLMRTIARSPADGDACSSSVPCRVCATSG